MFEMNEWLLAVNLAREEIECIGIIVTVQEMEDQDSCGVLHKIGVYLVTVSSF